MKRIFLFFCLLLVLFSSFSLADSYPKINISGFKKWEYKTVDVNPKSNYFLGVTQIGYSPTTSGLSWQEKLRLAITAELSKKLKVIYNIQQEPEMPEKFDVRVNYDDKHELIFGDINATFSNNEFASATKSLNGVMLKSKGDNYNLLLVPAAKLRSQIQALTSQKGNNTKGPYSLGHGSIVEGSERIELNGIRLTRGTDYIIDYFEGKVTFKEIITTLDEFKYAYEYTNILDLFFPTLSKRDFIGFQGDYTFDRTAITGEKFIPEFNRISSSEVFPNTTYSSEAQSELVQYRLSKYPLIQFSEKVSFEGFTLIKDEDYRIDYSEGLVSLFIADVPSSLHPLEVSYKYYKTSSKVESIPGIGSQGDYYFKNKWIIPQSERIKVDGVLFLKGFDYKIDYLLGTIFFFNKISNTSLIEATYSHRIIDKSKTKSKKRDTYAKVGMTFLKESAKQGGGLPTVAVSEKETGADIISNNNTIYLNNLPLVPTEEGGTITVALNGTDLTYGADYVVPSVEAGSTGQAIVTPSTALAFLNDKYDLSDGYDTGTIKLLRTVAITDEVVVSYNYHKSVYGKYSSYGDGSRDYEIKNYRNIVPGSEIVRVTIPGSSIITTYQRNSSPEAYDGGSVGYSINYYNDNPPEVIFNDPLPTNKNFTVEFRYVPPAADTGGDIKQDVFGMDFDVKFGKALELGGQFATSNKDRVVSEVMTSETFTSFTGSTRRLPKLGSTPVIENSEKVYVNSYLRNKDIDYTIDYITGLITFYYVTLGPSDSVVVDYSFESAGGAGGQAVANVGRAYKMSAKSSIGFFDFAYNKKDIGSNFTPMGGLSLSLGSNAQNFSGHFKPKYHDLVVGYDYKETNNLLSNSTSRFSRNYDRRYAIALDPNKMAKVGLNIRRYLTIADDNSVNNNQFDVGGSIVPAALKRGILTFNQKYEGKKTNLDNLVGLTKNTSDFIYLKEQLQITKKVKLSYDYQISEPERISYVGTGTDEVTSKSYSRNYSYDANVDLTMGRLKKWTAYAKMVRSEQFTIKPTAGYAETRNATYRMDLRPTKVLTTLYDYNRQETPSVVTLNKNPKSERTSASIKINPSSRLNGGYSYSENSNIYNTGKEGNGRSNSYDFKFVPIKTRYVEISNKLALLYRDQMSPSGSSESHLEEQTLTQSYAITFKPLSILSLTPGFVQSDYWNMKDNVFLRTQAQTSKASSTLNVFGTKLKGDYSLKVTTRLTDAVSRHKSLVGMNVTRGVYTWGTLIYKYSYEHNRGEVLSGGTFPDQDYQKKINDLSFNFKIPSTFNPVLSSIVLVARGKLLDYENNLKSTDNFKATSVSFEGTLNF